MWAKVSPSRPNTARVPATRMSGQGAPSRSPPTKLPLETFILPVTLSTDGPPARKRIWVERPARTEQTLYTPGSSLRTAPSTSSTSPYVPGEIVRSSRGASTISGPPHVRVGSGQRAPGVPGQGPVAPRIDPGLERIVSENTSKTLTPLASLTFLAVMLVLSGMKLALAIPTVPGVEPHAAISAFTVAALPSLTRRSPT